MAEYKITKADKITLRMLAAFGIAGLLLSGLAALSPQVQKVICSWEWVLPQQLDMCHPELTTKRVATPPLKAQ